MAERIAAETAATLAADPRLLSISPGSTESGARASIAYTG
jgi:hypothetical protein